MYRKINSGWLKHWDFELLDLICLEASFFLAYYLRHPNSFHISTLYLRLGLFIILFDLAVVFFTQNYSNIIQRTKWPELVATFQHVSVIQILVLVYTYLIKEAELYSRTVFLTSWAFALIICYGGRVLWKMVVRRNMTKEKSLSSMLLISTEERLGSCVNSLRAKPYRGFRVNAVCLLHENTDNTIFETNIPIIYGRALMLDYAKREVVDEVFIDYYTSREELTELVDTFLGMGITVHIGTPFLPQDLPNRMVEEIGNETAFTTSLQVAQEWKLTIKRAIDIVGGIIGLIFTGLMCIVVVPAIKLVDPGPAFFKQERVGKNGRIFHIYKFRSMYVDAESHLKDVMNQNEMQGLMFKLENDPRIIGSNKGPGKGLGNFLRKTSIDEFPQFLNVLRGDMSLVGTRPPTKKEYEQYGLHHKIRLSMKPGITGMWQVSGRSNITDFEKVVELDAYYIANWSLRLDFKMLLKTVVVLFHKEGSK